MRFSRIYKHTLESFVLFGVKSVLMLLLFLFGCHHLSWKLWHEEKKKSRTKKANHFKAEIRLFVHYYYYCDLIIFESIFFSSSFFPSSDTIMQNSMSVCVYVLFLITHIHRMDRRQKGSSISISSNSNSRGKKSEREMSCFTASDNTTIFQTMLRLLHAFYVYHNKFALLWLQRCFSFFRNKKVLMPLFCCFVFSL